MKILFVSTSNMPFGSNDLLFYKAAQTLVAEGHEVLVSPLDWGARNAPEYFALEAMGARVHRRPFRGRADGFLVRQIHKIAHRLLPPARDWAFVSEFRPDAVVVSDCSVFHFLSVHGLGEYLAECVAPFILVFQYNDENSALPEVTYRRAKDVFRAASRLIFVSKRNLEVAQRQICESLPNAVVIDNPPNVEVDQPLPFPVSSTARFCMVARLDSSVKGHALLLQILSAPKWLERDWRLDIFGSGKDDFYIRDLVQFLGLEGRVRVCGHASDVASVWADQQVLLMPSSAEGKPLALTEAMLCGRPAVVTDVGGNAELVQSGISGAVAESPTVPSFDRALEQMWQARGSWEAMGRAAHEFVRERHVVPPGKRLAEVIIDAGQARL